MPYRRTDQVVRKLAARHAAILQAAQALAAEGGMAAVQIGPVAERAGIAAGTVYRYFPAKTELVAALVAVLSEREMAALARAADGAPGPLSALAAAITSFAARALAKEERRTEADQKRREDDEPVERREMHGRRKSLCDPGRRGKAVDLEGCGATVIAAAIQHSIRMPAIVGCRTTASTQRNRAAVSVQ